jgi:exodeoxyribonuclease V beta subunit
MPVTLHAFPAGAGPGTLIHRVFERIDFALPDADAFESEVNSALRRHGLGPDLAPMLGAGIRQALATPLGGPLNAFSLGDLARRDRVDEMEFTLPVANAGSPPLTAASLADTFEAHAADSAFPGYAGRVRELGFPALQGHLRGFIDLTFRQAGRFYLADYKSNHLGDMPADYGPEALKSSMEHHDYVLQYHLYALALHRHLACRLPGYDYDSHMGGAYYLFLRGMSPASPGGLGIFYDRPSRALIEALSACLGDDVPGPEGDAA